MQFSIKVPTVLNDIDVYQPFFRYILGYHWKFFAIFVFLWLSWPISFYPWLHSAILCLIQHFGLSCAFSYHHHLRQSWAIFGTLANLGQSWKILGNIGLSWEIFGNHRLSWAISYNIGHSRAFLGNRVG